MTVRARDEVTAARRTSRWVIALTVSLLLVVLFASAVQAARFRGSGRSGCGLFADAVAQAEDGDVITPMTVARPSGGTVIDKNIRVMGGWSPPEDGCSEANVAYESMEEMVAAGFTYGGPEDLSTLDHEGGSVLNIDSQVISLTIQNVELINLGDAVLRGGGINGVLDGGGQTILENVVISGSKASNGGGLYLEVRGGAHLTIADSRFHHNEGIDGGGFEIRLYDGSTVTIENSRFDNNSSEESGGGGRILIDDGTVVIRNSSFTENSATGKGGGLAVEAFPGGGGDVYLYDVDVSSNVAGEESSVYAGSGVNVYSDYVYLPIIENRKGSSSGYTVQIGGITLENGAYVVDFTTGGFTPVLPGRHLHFFFDTVPESEAGMPGSGPWKIYGDSTPFTGYGPTDKPAGATQLCALVANPDHSVIAGSGGCYPLP